MNQQPIEKQSLRPDGALEVHSIWPTIQGEGPFAGSPAIFVRLAGCNLKCPFCDTEYTSKRELLTPDEIVWRVARWGRWKNPLVVITGGEPFRQNIAPLCARLLDKDYRVQVETNGTIYAPIHKNVVIVCSPKAGKLHPDLAKRVNAFKYVIERGQIDPNDGLPKNVLGNTVRRAARPPAGFDGNIYVQPIDKGDPELNKLETEAAVEVAMQYGYIFCLQVHKYINME